MTWTSLLKSSTPQSTEMKLAVGLGNPGVEYRDTYHNIGFCVADALAEAFCSPDFLLDKKSNAFLSEAVAFEQRVIICKPNTYMNLSGTAVSYLARYYKIEPKDIIVIYDDIDVVKGAVRARLSGSAGTHNGMRDIVSKLGTRDFARVRVGTGFKPDYMTLADYVLSRYSASDRPILQKACDIARDFVTDWIRGNEWREFTVGAVDRQ